MMRSMTCGMTPRPPLEKGTNAPVISSGVTSEVPSAIDGVASSGDVMPRRRAVAATAFGPTSAVSCAEIVLSDSDSAVSSVTGPRYSLRVVFRRPALDRHRLVDAHGLRGSARFRAPSDRRTA